MGISRGTVQEHGSCGPVGAIAGRNVAAVACGGIGQGALRRLTAAGMKVYRAHAPTVKDTVAQFKAGQLQEMSEEEACAHHDHH